MSLFDDVFDDSSFAPEQFGPQEGFAGTLLAASACDGHIADEEVGALITTLSRMKMYQNVPPHKFSSMMDRLLGVLKRGGPEKLIAVAIPAVPPELRETVFANACDIVLADGVVEADEKAFIDDLMIKLEMDSQRAKTIVQVMVYKNQG
ncbi:tellurite resistance TerB family protein [Blastopirellula sp. JC732]|uniref:Tellurite resistance TerB family protein n=1 Tax=Blastopirellula sediminis TaxID=2894196 RepID=A0A9X1MHX9_9BACT|nr:tellurite resistance TerB family protein [Blastopirellula sediminis]MCC9607734.1 tellurite resistance TerB family protein [Blastopirellula sediminis]MCC9627473.1 tellurite resistance TerB family protein [Blastopirellula sediminis]